ncbi:hypothetical protein EC968_004608 [Mortierella alpina]|nr:hypothetical protein EC968_004608 [Mortierella alpina]
MRLSSASRFLAVCGLALLVAAPTAVQAQSTREPRSSTTTTTTTTTVAATPPPTQPPRTTAPPVTPTAAPPQPSRPVQVSSANNRPSSAPAPTATGLPLPTDGSCVSTAGCAALPGTICGYTSANATVGSCIEAKAVCPMSPVMTCATHADCPTEFSYCTANGGQMVCTGLGRPGTDTECKDTKDSGITTTLKYAGIAVGCVAALGIVFAGVRWQKRRQRSKGIPADMFGEVDYGMTDRAPSKAAEQNYPFSSRPNAHGSDVAPTPPGFDNGYDNNQYYEEPVGYNNHHNNNGYGHDQYDNGQYYGNQKDGYGYDQQQHHGGGGDGFYNNAGYDDYQQHPQGIASPAAAARVASPRQNFDQYGAEPSELDFGGHHGGSAHGGSGHAGGGYGRY